MDLPKTDYYFGDYRIKIGPCAGLKLKDANREEVEHFIKILRAVQGDDFQPAASELIAMAEAFYAKEPLQQNTTDETDVSW